MNHSKLLIVILMTTSAVCSAEETKPPLQSLIDQAPSGAVLRIPAGTYHGNFTIKQSITVTALLDVILDGNGSGTVLKVEAPKVTLDGLIFQNSGSVIGNSDSAVLVENSPEFMLKNSVLRNTLFGVQLLASPHSVIQKNEMSSLQEHPLGTRGDLIKVWYSPGVKILDNDLHDGRDVLVWYSNNSVLNGNHITRMRYGLHFMYSHENVVLQNRFEQSSVGVYNMYGNGLILEENEILYNRGPSGYGVAIKEADRTKLTKNRIIGNRIGLQLDNAPLSPPQRSEDMTVFNMNLLKRNDIGVSFVGSGYGSVFIKNDFVDNWQQVSTSGLQSNKTSWTNNYWSDYRGVDPSGTGVGIIPYVADSISDGITDRFESFKIFNFGPAMIAIEFAQRIIPWIKSDPKAVDVVPAVAPHMNMNAAPMTFKARLYLCLASFALLGMVYGIYRKFVL